MRAALRWFFFVFLAVGGAISGCGTLISRPYADEYQDFSKHAILAMATVTDAEPQNHNGVGYDYTVEDRLYHGGWFAGRNGNPNADHLKPGDKIRIYYRSDYPAQSCACDPWEEGRDPAPFWALIGGLVGFWTAFGVAGERYKKLHDRHSA